VAKEVTQVVVPEERVWEPQPVMVVPEFLKLTVPVGVAPGPVTVAVRVTDWLVAAGLGDAVKLAVEPVELTVTVSEPVDAL
jgi:hypothetical protein